MLGYNKLLMSCIILFLFVGIANAVFVDKVVYYDENYKAVYILNCEDTVDFLKSKEFVVKNAVELKEWMKSKIEKGAYQSVCVMAMGVAPDTVYETVDRECTIFKYLKSGGRIVWIVGSYPLWRLGTADNDIKVIGSQGPTMVLGVRADTTDYEALNIIVDLNPVARNLGMKVLDRGKFVVYRSDVTLVLSSLNEASLSSLDKTAISVASTEDSGASEIQAQATELTTESGKASGYACSWFKNYNKDYFNSGFIRYRATWYNGSDKEQNEDMLRLALVEAKKTEELQEK